MNTVMFHSLSVIPSKVVCVGRNYVEHVSELNNEIPTSLVLFHKPNSAITEKLFSINDRYHFETEISFLVREGKIAGVALGLDITDRETQSFLKNKGLPWERAKSFDNSAVFSTFVPLSEGFEKLWFELSVNNKLTQKGGYDSMIYKPEDILSEIQSFMTLFDNDIIMTGTPKGVGTYKRGDIFFGKLYSDLTCLLEVTWIAE